MLGPPQSPGLLQIPEVLLTTLLKYEEIVICWKGEVRVPHIVRKPQERTENKAEVAASAQGHPGVVERRFPLLQTEGGPHVLTGTGQGFR